MKKILLKGYYGFGNLGDDILLKVSHQLLRRRFPQADISVYSENTPNNPNFADSEEYNHYISAIIKDQCPIVDWTYVESYDLLFNGGGGLYKDHRQGSWKFAVANTIAKKLSPQKIRKGESMLRQGLQKKQNIQYDYRVGFGLSIGPFTHTAPTFVKSLSEIGSYNSLFVRDDASIRFLKSVGFENHYERITDIAFLTDYWLPKGLTNKNQSTEEKSIGVILLDWHEKNDVYFENIKQTADCLIKKGIKVQYISFQESFDKKFQDFFKGQVITWNPHRMSLEEFLAVLKQQSLLITARAHGAILGACLGVPSICLGITLKLEEVARMLKNSSKMIAPPFRSEEVVQAVMDMLDQYEIVVEKLEEDCQFNKTMALQAESTLLQTLEKIS